jgi:PPOX class probable F420-dependent enzyme
MIPPQASDFLQTHTRTFLVTLREDGAPACHPMVAIWRDGALYMTTYRKSAKVAHLMREPRVACLVVTADDDPNFRGVSLRGRAEVMPAGTTMPGVADRSAAPAVGAETNRRVATRMAEGKRIVVRVVVDDVRLVGEHG